jgi:hypothetical protein
MACDVSGFCPATRVDSGMSEPESPDNDSPGVPGFRRWRGVYMFVLGVFIAIVVALTVFTRYFA